MSYLDERCGRTEPPDLYAPDIPEECPSCEEPLDQLDHWGCCPRCGAQVEPTDPTDPTEW